MYNLTITRHLSLPPELFPLPQWVMWQKEFRNGKQTKVPYNPNACDIRASVKDPQTWATFYTCKEKLESNQGKFDGIGFVFTATDPFCGIDLDKCRNPETGEIEEWANEIIKEVGSYTEISPSGTGVHILIKGELPPGRRRKDKVEMYDRGRYFCMTGDRYSNKKWLSYCQM